MKPTIACNGTALRAWTCCAGLSAFAAAPALAAPELRTLDFLPAVQSIMQGSRVHLVNLAESRLRVNAPPDPCRIAVHFLDVQGNDIGAPQAFAITAGQTATAVAPTFVTTGLPTTIRAHVEVVPTRAAPPDPCAQLHGSYEVFDTQSLETRFTNPGVIRGFNPQPDPPGNVGR